MSGNVRFYAMIVGIVLVVAILFWVVQKSADEGPNGQQAQAPVNQEVAHQEETGGTVPEVSQEETAEAAAPAQGPGKGPKRHPQGNGGIRGTVVQAPGGQPVAGARVVAELQKWELGQVPGQHGPTWEAVSDETGRFRIDKLPTPKGSLVERISYVLTAEHEGAFALQQTYISERSPLGEATLELREASALSGRVVDETGTAIAGARVFPYERKNPSRRRSYDTAIASALQTASDEEGAFTLAHLPADEWKLTVLAEGFATHVSDFFPPNSADLAIVLSKGASASGRVLTFDTKAPKAGVTLNFNASENPLDMLSATTDEEGRFEVGALSNATYSAKLESDALVIAGQTRDFTIEHGESKKDLEFLVGEGGVVSGRVYNQDTDAPIPGVTIQAQPQGASPVYRSATSGADGSYRIAGLSPGTYVLNRDWKEGYPNQDYRQRKMVSAEAGSEVKNMDFPLKRGLRLRGRVVDSTGKPVTMVHVNGRIDGGRRAIQGAQTGDDGVFEHAGYLPGDRVTLRIYRKGYAAPPQEPIIFGEEDISGVEIVAETGASIAGTVVNKRGMPLADMMVFAWPKDGDRSRTQRTTSMTDGSFKVEGLLPATYEVRVNPADYYGSREGRAQEITVTKSQDVTGIRLVFEEPEGLSIAGRITSTSGKPVQGARLYAYPKNGGSTQGNAHTDGDGRYELKGLQEGVYRMHISHANYSSPRNAEARAGDQHADFALEGRGAVEGRVLDVRTGQPITQFQLTHWRGMHEKLQSWMASRMVSFHDEKGQFRLEGVDAGESTVIAQARGCAPAFRVVSGVQEGKTISGIELRLSAGGVIEGTVKDVAGQPIINAQIHVGASVHSWQQDQGGAASTDGSGAFRLDSLDPATQAITVYHRAYAQKTVPVQLAAGQVTPVKIVLGEGGQIEGTVRVGGQPLSGVYVGLRYTDQTSQSRSYAHTDAQGFYAIKGLPAGTAVVNAQLRTSPGVWRGNSEKSALIAEGRVTTVDFDLVGGTAAIEGTITCDGQIPPSARVSAMMSSDADLPEVFSGRMDAKGNYKFTNLPAGTVTIEVVARMGEDETLERSVPVEAIDNQVVRQDIQLTRGGRIYGAVAGLGEGATGFTVALKGEVQIPNLTPDAFARYQKLFATAPNPISGGTYKMSGLEPGTYTVVALAMGADPTDLSSARFTTAVVTIKEAGEAVQTDLAIP